MRKLAFLTAVLVLVSLVAGMSDTARQAEASSSYVISYGVPVMPTNRGVVFFDTSFSVPYRDGPARLSANPDGTGNVVVDDELIVTVTRPDASVATFTFDYSRGCRGFISPAAPHDIASLFRPGTNQVRVQFRDRCGRSASAGSLWLVLAPTPLSGSLSISSANAPVGHCTNVFFGDVAGDCAIVDLMSNVPSSPGLGAWTVNIQYDPAIMHIVNSCLFPHCFSICNGLFGPDIIRCTGAGAGGLVGSTTLARIAFQCDHVGTSSLTLNVEVFADATIGNPQNINASVANGSINCTAPNALRYLATGDSIPAGADIGSSCDTTPPPCTSDPSSAYPSFLAARLAQVNPTGVVWANRSCSGSTSSEYIDVPRCTSALSQLSIGTSPEQARDLITITLGADDYALATLARTCLPLINQFDIGGAATCAENVLVNEGPALSQLDANLTQILTRLAEANPTAVIVVTNYYNPLPTHIDVDKCIPRGPDHLFAPFPILFACDSIVGDFNRMLSAADDLVTDLNLKLASIANRQAVLTNGRVLLANIHDQFEGHCTAIQLQIKLGITFPARSLGCDMASTWIAPTPSYSGHIVLWGVNLDVTQAGVHGNRTGNQCIASVVWETAKSRLGFSEPAMPDPCP